MIISEGVVLKSNYMIKPTAEQALRINRGSSCRCGLSWRWTSMERTWMLVALSMSLVASSAICACTVEEGPWFGELLEQGQSVVVITPTVITAPAPSNLKADDADGVVVNFLAPVTAKVRIVEVLVGAAPALEEVSYLFSWCAGHRLDVDRYYVLAVAPSEQTHNIRLGGNELLGIGDEYLEQTGSEKARPSSSKRYSHTGNPETSE